MFEFMYIIGLQTSELLLECLAYLAVTHGPLTWHIENAQQPLLYWSGRNKGEIVCQYNDENII